MKTKLDAAVVAAAQCPEGKRRLDVYCSVVTGLVLEVRPSGGKTFYARYTDQYGKLRQVKLGTADRISFDQARKAARKILAEAELGRDPAAAKAEKRAVPLYVDLAVQHMADAKLHARSYTTMEGYVRNHLIPRWGRVRLTDIEPRAVAQWLADKRASGLAPATVLKLKMLLSRSFELGRQWGVPGCDRNPTRGVRLPPMNNARQTFLNADEAARLLRAAADTRNPQLPAILHLLLLTGMRVSELLSARWRDLDIAGQRLFVPTSKTGRSRHVPLSRAALDVLAGLPRAEGAAFLFPNPRDPSRHLTTIKHAFQSARAAAGLPELHVHDLRHSAASAMVAGGVDLYAVGKVLGHASVASTARYSHLANDTLLRAVEAGAGCLNLSA